MGNHGDSIRRSANVFKRHVRSKKPGVLCADTCQKLRSLPASQKCSCPTSLRGLDQRDSEAAFPSGLAVAASEQEVSSRSCARALTFHADPRPERVWARRCPSGLRLGLLVTGMEPIPNRSCCLSTEQEDSGVPSPAARADAATGPAWTEAWTTALPSLTTPAPHLLRALTLDTWTFNKLLLFGLSVDYLPCLESKRWDCCRLAARVGVNPELATGQALPGMTAAVSQQVDSVGNAIVPT